MKSLVATSRFLSVRSQRVQRWVWQCSRQPPVFFNCTLRPMRMQDHRHPIAGHPPPPNRRRRIASRKCEGPSRGDVGLVSRGFTLRGRFPGFSIVRLSQMAIVVVLHCYRSNPFFEQAYEMAMRKEGRSTLLGPLAAPPSPPPPQEAWGADRSRAGGNGHRLRQVSEPCQSLARGPQSAISRRDH